MLNGASKNNKRLLNPFVNLPNSQSVCLVELHGLTQSVLYVDNLHPHPSVALAITRGMYVVLNSHRWNAVFDGYTNELLYPTALRRVWIYTVTYSSYAPVSHHTPDRVACRSSMDHWHSHMRRHLCVCRGSSWLMERAEETIYLIYKNWCCCSHDVLVLLWNRPLLPTSRDACRDGVWSRIYVTCTNPYLQIGEVWIRFTMVLPSNDIA